MPRHLIPRKCTATPPSYPALLPLRVRFSTRAIRSARRSSYVARTSLVTPASERAPSITCVQVHGPTRPAAANSTDRSYGRLYCLPETPADAMIDVTQVAFLSVRRELRSEYAELSFYIFCVLPHSVPVKVASRSTLGGETAGQLYSKRLSISYHPTSGK